MTINTKSKQDDNVDEARNPFVKDAESRFNKYEPGKELNKRESSELDNIAEGLEQDGGLEGFGDNDNMGADLKSEEETAGSSDTGFYDRSEGPANRPFTEALDTRKMKDTVIKIAKSKSPLFAIFSMFSVTGVIIFFIFSPVSLLTSLSEQFQLFNDPTVPAFQARALKLIGHISTNQENHNLCNRTKLNCHMGKFSNNALRKFQKNGLEPYWADGTREIKKTVRPTYPDKNPSGYKVDMQDGTFKNISSAELEGFLKDKGNRKVARRVIGTGGVLSLRTKAWTSYYLREKFFK